MKKDYPLNYSVDDLAREEFNKLPEKEKTPGKYQKIYDKYQKKYDRLFKKHYGNE